MALTSFTALFRPLPNRSGVQLVQGAAAIGTGGLALTETATVSVNVPMPRRTCKLLSLNVTVQTAAAGSGAITVQAFKRDNVGTPANRTLTGTLSLVVATADKAYAMPITTTTDSQLIFTPGDTLRIDVVAAGTVTTAPQAVISAEFAVID